MGADGTTVRVTFVGLDGGRGSALADALDGTTRAVDRRRARSVDAVGAATDCVVVTPDDRKGAVPVERVERAVTTLDGTPVVAVAAAERLDALLATGVDDVVTDDDLARRGALAARRIVRLARAHRATTVERESGGGSGRACPAEGRPPRQEDRLEFREDLVGRDREFLYSFLDVTMDPEASFDEQVGSLLELCCDTLEFDVGVLSRVSDHDYEIRAVHAPGEHIAAGESFDLEDTYCKHVVDTASVEWFFDAVDTGRVESRSYTSTGHEAYLGLPVTVGDDLYGTLCLTSETSRDEPITDADVALARLVTEWVGSDLLRARRQRELESLTERLESLVETTPLAIVGLTPDRTVTKWNAAAESMFGWEAEEVLGEDYPLIPAAESASAEGLHDRTFSGERFHGKEIRRETRSGEVLDLRLSTAPVRAEGDGYQEVWGVIDDVTENREFERKLRALQTTTNRLNVAADADAVVDVTIEAVAEVLGHPLATFWSYDESSGTLVPATRSETADRRFESLPSFEPGDGRLWEVFSTGEPQVYSDLSRVDDRYEGVQSGIAVPLGDHGVLGAGSPASNEYDQQDLELVRILAAAAEAALTRADRERRLRETNERLDEFASVVAHDLRTPLTSAVGFLDIARETGSQEHFDRVEAAHDRMEDLIEDLLALARTRDRALDRRPASLDAVVEEAWSYVDTNGTSLATDSLGEVSCDPDQLGRLFENLFRNAVEHGHAETLAVERLDDGGFAVEDDGTGFDRPTEVLFERGQSSSTGGIGFGLSIVADIAAAHDWTVDATDAACGGARIEVRPT